MHETPASRQPEAARVAPAASGAPAAAPAPGRVRAIQSTIAQLGWLNGLLYFAGRLLAAATRDAVRLYRYYIVAQPVPAKRWLPPHRGALIAVRQIAAGDPTLAAFPRPEWVYPYRFDQGAICLGAFQEQECIGFLWLALGPFPEDEVRCRYVPLPEGAGSWDFDVYLSPEHRGSFAFLRMWDEANALLTARGIRYSLSRISAFNSNSMLSHTRMGARRIGALTFLALGSWQLAVSTVRPYVHLSTGHDSYPIYRLDPGPSPRQK